MKTTALNRYLVYIESDDEITYKVRMEREWDDYSYKTCIELLMAVIRDYKESELVPLSVMFFFTSRIPVLLGMTAHPEFFANTTDAYRELIRVRRQELMLLQEQFFSGELFMR